MKELLLLALLITYSTINSQNSRLYAVNQNANENIHEGLNVGGLAYNKKNDTIGVEKIVKMKKFGLIGGIGPESTIEYYQQIIKKFRELTGSNTYPDLLIQSVDMSKIIEHVNKQDEKSLIDFLVDRIKIIENANVDFGAIASNTPHMVFDELSKQVNIPLLSIVEETCKVAKSKRYKTIGLLGTMTTMTKGFYQKTAEKYGIKIVTPTKNQMNYVHEKYINELLYRNIRQETKNELISIVHELTEKHSIKGLILGGTELPLILNQNDFENIEILDTTQIHVESIVRMMINE